MEGLDEIPPLETGEAIQHFLFKYNRPDDYSVLHGINILNHGQQHIETVSTPCFQQNGDVHLSEFHETTYANQTDVFLPFASIEASNGTSISEKTLQKNDETKEQSQQFNCPYTDLYGDFNLETYLDYEQCFSDVNNEDVSYLDDLTAFLTSPGETQTQSNLPCRCDNLTPSADATGDHIATEPTNALPDTEDTPPKANPHPLILSCTNKNHSPANCTCGLDSRMISIPSPKIQNVVASANLTCTLTLREIALNAPDAEYQPNMFPGVVLRIRNPRTTAMVFASGKINCTGAKSEEEARVACKKYARIIQGLGYPVKFKEFRITNIVASLSLDCRLRIEDLESEYSRFCTYEAELFPGLIYRMLTPRTVFLVFKSGKVIIVGAKTKKHIEEAFQNFCPILRQFAGTGIQQPKRYV